jgi:hypothetical protein
LFHSFYQKGLLVSIQRHKGTIFLGRYSPQNIFLTFAPVKTKSFTGIAQVVELVDTQDLKSCGQKWLYGFDSRPEHEADRPAKFLAGLFCLACT